MKKILIPIAMLLIAFSAASQANDGKTTHGVIHFVGSIERGPCEYSTATWSRHAGRINGVSPGSAGAAPAANGICAGVADTSSIKTYEVASTSRSTIRGKVVIVTFN
ncbi:hypothetical protein [Pseudomonas sp. BN411]|uniref:hypothetical protein n=1 Tax=Pseudomonas sp. BN411 TaxID=2567887 RepID=UPI0024544EDA|nr:hypothetical protein [Pseudomonas sp. BN411]MDH4563643.1 hypothetical protein [Pseudomonas sp. BN411]